MRGAAAASVLSAVLLAGIAELGAPEVRGPLRAAPCPVPVQVSAADASLPEDEAGLHCVSPKTGQAELIASLCGLAAPAVPAATAAGAASSGERLVLSCATGSVHVLPMELGMRLAVGAPVDLDLAGRDDLVALPGVGPSLAERILTARRARPGGRFSSVDDLRGVRGIGPATLARLRPLVTVGEIPLPVIPSK